VSPAASWLLLIIAVTSLTTAVVMVDAWLWKRRERQLEERRRRIRNLERHYRKDYR